MLIIKKFGGKTTISCTPVLDEYEKDILEYAGNCYSFVNGVKPYAIDGKDWIENIKSVYDANEPRTKEVIRVLENIILR